MIDCVPAGRLPLSFHQTFLPERQYITALLDLAAPGGTYSVEAIASRTGIPTGSSSGKVPSTLSYCRGMGLIRAEGLAGKDKELGLTPFGEIVWKEDRYLSEELTWWLCHLNLCRRHGGAELWFLVFNKGRAVLGMRCGHDRLETYLRQEIDQGKRLSLSPLKGMYTEPGSFPLPTITWTDQGEVAREQAPVQQEYCRGYIAWLLGQVEHVFPGRDQVTLTEIADETGWESAAGWAAADTERVLGWGQSRGLLDVDRQMRPWVISPRVGVNKVWRTIYDELI